MTARPAHPCALGRASPPRYSHVPFPDRETSSPLASLSLTPFRSYDATWLSGQPRGGGSLLAFPRRTLFPQALAPSWQPRGEEAVIGPITHETYGSAGVFAAPDVVHRLGGEAA